MPVTKDNIKNWVTKMKHNISTPQLFYKKYGVDNKDEYIKLIEDNIENQTKLNELDELFKKNSLIIEEKNKKIEKERIKNLLEESSKRYNTNTKIRMLRESDEKKAIELYKQFKEDLNEDIDVVESYTNDFIIKNIMFGIFINKILVGLIIIQNNRDFKTDFSSKKIQTFYIQDIVIDRNYRNKGLAELLFHYILLRCPNDILYISFMTTPSNFAMQKLAKKYHFILQTEKSGDTKHCLLYIRKNDKFDIDYYSKHPFIQGSLSSSSKI